MIPSCCNNCRQGRAPCKSRDKCLHHGRIIDRFVGAWARFPTLVAAIALVSYAFLIWVSRP